MQLTSSLGRTALAALLFFGISALAAPTHAQTVTNGGFEDSDTTDGHFTGWTLSGNADYLSANPNTFVFGNPHSGDYAAWLGAPNSDGFLSQTLATTPGQAYTISYWLASDTSSLTNTVSNDFSASFGGQSLFSQTNLAATDGHADSADDYTLYSFTEVATGTSSVLQFGFRNDGSEFRLDDVGAALAPIPESSTTISFGLLLALGTGVVVLQTRRRRQAE